MAYDTAGKDFKVFDLPTLSKQLQDYVYSMCRFRQICTIADKIGTGKGIAHRWFFPGTEPAVRLYERMPARNETLKELTYSIMKNQGVSRELGVSMKYNIHDIDMAQLPIKQYLREILARDCARMVDYMVKAQLDLTPFKYLPYDENHGVQTTPNSFIYRPQGEAYALADEGKIPLSERIVYAGWGDTSSAYIRKYPAGTFAGGAAPYNSANSVCLVPNPVTFVARAGGLAGYANKNIPCFGPFIGSVLGEREVYPINMSQCDPSQTRLTWNVDYKPTLNYKHVFNMIMQAQQNKIYGFSRYGGDYVLVCSPAQAASLYSSLLLDREGAVAGDGMTLRALLKPQNLPDVQGVLIGEDKKLPFGLPVRVVIDNEGVFLEENWLEEGAIVDAVPNQVDTMVDTLSKSLFGAQIDCQDAYVDDNIIWPAGGQAGTETSRVKGSAGFISHVTAGVIGPTTRGGRNWVATGGGGYSQLHYGIGRRDQAAPVPCVNRRFPELGPCYLIGSGAQDPVQEILSRPEEVVTMSAQDFNRFSGLAWKMHANWYPTNVIGTMGWVDGLPAANQGGDPFFDVRGKEIKTALWGMRCIKFDYPVFLKDSAAVAYV